MNNDIKHKRRIKKIIISLTVITIFLAFAFYTQLTIKHYTVTKSEISDGSNIRIVLLSDLHSCIYGENQTKLINKIKKQKPDIILMVGDIADDVTPINGTKLLLNEIVKLAPCYYVSGNHEFWSDDIDNIKQVFISYGVEVLEGEYKSIEVKKQKLNICGVDDPYVLSADDRNSYADLLMPFKSLSSADFNILLAHRPEYIYEYKKYEFDLVLSGHAHGGQWRIPFILNGLYAPNQGFFPKYAGGLYKHNDLVHIVSRGLSFNPRLPRIFNPPEIVVIDLVSKNIS